MISLALALWADYIHRNNALNSISTFLRQFYSGDLANFAGCTIIFFFVATLIIWWFGHIVALPRWTWLLLLSKGISLVAPVLYGIFFPLPLLTPNFSALFCCDKFMKYFSLRHLHFLGKLFLGVFSKFLRDLIDNSKCKEECSKSEINVVEITQIRLKNEEEYSYDKFLLFGL